MTHLILSWICIKTNFPGLFFKWNRRSPPSLLVIKTIVLNKLFNLWTKLFLMLPNVYYHFALSNRVITLYILLMRHYIKCNIAWLFHVFYQKHSFKENRYFLLFLSATFYIKREAGITNIRYHRSNMHKDDDSQYGNQYGKFWTLKTNCRDLTVNSYYDMKFQASQSLQFTIYYECGFLARVKFNNIGIIQSNI